jgi:hypothetical protein
VAAEVLGLRRLNDIPGELIPIEYVRFLKSRDPAVLQRILDHNRNGFVERYHRSIERYHRSYTEECLRVERPRTVEEVRMVTAAYRAHYNFERPNQALSCGNRPPRVAFPTLPARPSVPLFVDPDAWLETIDGRSYVRRVQENGCVVVGDAIYYVGRDRGGQEVAFLIDA